MINVLVMKRKKRLDLVLQEKGLFDSRTKAQVSVVLGEVLINEKIVNKPSYLISEEDKISIVEKKQKFVGRGGEKLYSAIKEFNINVKDKIAIDIGASTGGFSECLIRNGAKLVFAIDVGHSQLDESLKNNPKIINLEKVNARYLTLKSLKNIIKERAYSDKISDLSQNINFGVIDVSFISILKIISALKNILKPGSEIIALIKPQFEAGKNEIGKGGIIKDREVIEKVVEKVKNELNNTGLKIIDTMPSPILGTKGNQEYLFYMKKEQ